MLILASQSATRKSLLAGAGLAFETRVAGVDERAIEAELLAAGTDPAGVAAGLAIAKAEAVAKGSPGDVVIGADQVLALSGRLFHKPQNLAEAGAQLDLLRGRTHHLHAAVALAGGNGLLWSTVETARLTMRSFSPAERDAVLRREGEALLAAVGAYRLEGASIRLFERIEGDYFTILGLPLLPLLAALRRHAPDLLDGS
jgi:septum formation protein